MAAWAEGLPRGAALGRLHPNREGSASPGRAQAPQATSSRAFGDSFCLSAAQSSTRNTKNCAGSRATVPGGRGGKSRGVGGARLGPEGASPGRPQLLAAPLAGEPRGEEEGARAWPGGGEGGVARGRQTAQRKSAASPTLSAPNPGWAGLIIVAIQF